MKFINSSSALKQKSGLAIAFIDVLAPNPGIAVHGHKHFYNAARNTCAKVFLLSEAFRSGERLMSKQGALAAHLLRADFTSDNAAGGSPKVVAAIAEAAVGRSRPYGDDGYTSRVREKLGAIFERDVDVFVAPTGSAAQAPSVHAVRRVRRFGQRGARCLNESARMSMHCPA